jgi:tetratricopeptide (TPR) repeat protein
MVAIDTDAMNQPNSLNLTKTYTLLKESAKLERRMAHFAMNRGQFDVSEGHCHRCLVNSRRLGVEGEDKTTLIYSALCVYIQLRQFQGDYSGAETFAEEAYNLVVDVYNPVHPQVQQAAGYLIDCLIKKDDLSNAERYAEQTYANLRDIKNGMDQEGELVAQGAYSLANVISRQDDGDLIKAEGLAREAIRIRDQLYGAHHGSLSLTYQLLARILQDQGNFGDETKELLERSLSIAVRNEGPDGVNTAVANIVIGQFYYQFAMKQSVVHKKRSPLILAKSYYDEGIRIETKIHSPTHPNMILATSILSEILNELSRI